MTLKNDVWRYMADHPTVVSISSCKELYKVFKATTKKSKMLIRKYKAEYKDWLKENPVKPPRSNKYLAGNKKKKEVKKDDLNLEAFKPYEERVQCSSCPGLFASELIKFVGFRGSVEKVRHPKGGWTEVVTLDPRGEVHRGEARPEPIVPVSRKRNLDNLMRLTGLPEEKIGSKFYVGILKYEVEIMTLIFFLKQMGHEDIMVLAPRGHGKTYINAWDCQVDLKWFYKNIMMLSETSARFKVGNWIYLWALHNNYLRDPEKFARKSTYQHFEIVNGTRMDIYKYTEENLVGEHDYTLKLDDTVKKKWQVKPTENEKVKEHWDSNVNYIIRTGLEDFGTRKFEGDPLQHRMETIEGMIVIKLSPFVACEHSNLNDQGTYDPCDVCRDLCLLAPEIHSYNELMNKMESNYESWYSEMMQDPHPRKGGMVDEEDIEYITRVEYGLVKLLGIGVDVAEVWEDTTLTDMSAIVDCVMSYEQDKERQRRKFTFTDAELGRFPFRTTKDSKGRTHEGLIEKIDRHVRFLKRHYPDKPLIIAIERTGPGMQLIEQIMREKLDWMYYIVADKGQAVKWSKDGRANVPLGIKHLKEKVSRIYSELQHPIKEAQARFTENLRGTVFMIQLTSFPKGKHDDGPDAAGLIKDELNRRWSEKKQKKGKRDPKEVMEEKRAQKAFENMKEPWKAVQQGQQRNASSRRGRY